MPVGIAHADVAAVIPALAQRLGRGLRVVPVFDQHVRARARPPRRPCPAGTSLPSSSTIRPRTRAPAARSSPAGASRPTAACRPRPERSRSSRTPAAPARRARRRRRPAAAAPVSSPSPARAGCRAASRSSADARSRPAWLPAPARSASACRCAIASSVASGAKRACSVTVAPSCSAGVVWMLSPPTWNSGSTVSTWSCGRHVVHVLAHGGVRDQRLLAQHRTLGVTRRARRVDDEQRRARIHFLCAAAFSSARNQRIERERHPARSRRAPRRARPAAPPATARRSPRTPAPPPAPSRPASRRM